MRPSVVGHISCLILILPLSLAHNFLPLPFLRGGSTAASRTRPQQRRPQHRRHHRARHLQPHRARGPLAVLLRIAHRAQSDAAQEWKRARSKLRQQSSQLASLMSRMFRVAPPKLSARSSQLDDVLQAFSLLRPGADLDTALLLRACRTHLALMKSGGASLRWVAQDLESNLLKAESLLRTAPPGARDLTSLLQIERAAGVHDGSVLKDPSAAIGLLWIRRSLAFQSQLYEALLSDDLTPRDAALAAYHAHLYPFHGWALRKIFPASLAQMPDRNVFLARFAAVDVDQLDDQLQRQLLNKIKALIALWNPILKTWRHDFDKMNMEDTTRV